MAAPYVKRYGGGFLDLPTQTTPVDSAFLNAVEDALVRLLGVAPAVDTVGVWTPGGGSGALVYQKITNAQIAAGAAIDKSKLAALNITDADIAGAAAIAKSKLGPLNITNADIQAAAAIAISKLAGYPGVATQALHGDGSWKEPAGRELGYAQIIAGVTVTALTEATADTVVTAPAINFDGTSAALIEFFAVAAMPSITAVGRMMEFFLYDGAASMGRLGLLVGETASATWEPVFLSRRLVPTAGIHTYSIRASINVGAGEQGTILAGAGNAPGSDSPAFIRISKYT